MLCNIASLQVHRLKSSELIPYSLIACILQPECFKVGCLLPGWTDILPSTLWLASDHGGLRKSWKIYENSKVLPVPQKTKHDWSTNPVRAFFLNVPTKSVSANYVNKLCQRILCQQIMCQQILCQQIMCQQILCEQTLSTNYVNKFCPQNMSTNYASVICVNKLCQQIVSTSSASTN